MNLWDSVKEGFFKSVESSLRVLSALPIGPIAVLGGGVVALGVGYNAVTNETFLSFLMNLFFRFSGAILLFFGFIWEQIYLLFIKDTPLDPIFIFMKFSIKSIFAVIGFIMFNLDLVLVFSQVVVVFLTMSQRSMSGYISTFISLEWALINFMIYLVFSIVNLLYWIINTLIDIVVKLFNFISDMIKFMVSVASGGVIR